MTDVGLIAFPMHGQHKLSNEGYRTRDGHLIEWFGRILGSEKSGYVSVVSRPEPRILAREQRYDAGAIAPNTRPVTTFTWRVPTSRDRQRWWITSLPAYPRSLAGAAAPIVTWNPFLSLSSAWNAIVDSGEPVAFDLLDDWTIHFAFEGIRPHVIRAYQTLFEHADVVTANAEGTAELARRFGRDDVVLLPNGCDPERFTQTSTASGAPTVGYVGKIGKRLDLDLIIRTARELPTFKFVFAGPILDVEYRAPMAATTNIQLLGDVHYDGVPRLLQTFDVGWVPHRVGEGEVGGDVMKTYEYRAAGLPVVTTPVTGAADRGLDAVTVVRDKSHAPALASLISDSGRAHRVATKLPVDIRWESKAETILRALRRSSS